MAKISDLRKNGIKSSSQTMICRRLMSNKRFQKYLKIVFILCFLAYTTKQILVMKFNNAYANTNRLIEENKVIIFSKTWCPYCTKAKRIFKKHNVPYTTIELDETRDGFFIEMAIVKKTKQTTVPVIFMSGLFIGGSDSLERIEKKGGLSKFEISGSGNEISDVK